jgi:hypothetical protein
MKPIFTFCCADTGPATANAAAAAPASSVRKDLRMFGFLLGGAV